MPTVSSKRLAAFSQQMGTCLNAGLDVRNSFKNCENLLGKGHKANCLKIADMLQDGDMLYQAFKKSNSTFPPLMTMMVEVGEISGKTEAAFKGLADNYQHRVSLIRTFIKGISWPILQFVMATGIFGIVLLVFTVFLGNGEAADLIPDWVGNINTFYTYCTVVTLGYMFVIGTVVAIYMQWLNVGIFLGVVMKIPGLRNPFLNLALSRLCWTFALVHNAGVDARGTAAMAIRSTGNPLFIRELTGIRDSLRKNHEFYTAFSKADIFPTAFLASLMTAEQTGTITESLLREAAVYREVTETQFTWLTRITGGIIYGCVGIVVVAMIFILFKALYLDPINNALKF
ncbi:MAG: type II secretion system F family protein [Pirellulales bacterium]|jgi:type II secretory pathway component PulF